MRGDKINYSFYALDCLDSNKNGKKTFKALQLSGIIHVQHRVNWA